MFARQIQSVSQSWNNQGETPTDQDLLSRSPKRERTSCSSAPEQAGKQQSSSRDSHKKHHVGVYFAFRTVSGLLRDEVRCLVTAVDDNASRAAKFKIEAGDVLLQVEGLRVCEAKFKQVVKSLEGTDGEVLSIVVGKPAQKDGWKATRVKPMRVLASCVCAPTTELPSGSCVEEDKEEEEEEEEGHIEQATRRRRRVENSISAEEGQRKVAAQASNKKANGANKRGLRRKKTKNAGKGIIEAGTSVRISMCGKEGLLDGTVVRQEGGKWLVRAAGGALYLLAAHALQSSAEARS